MASTVERVGWALVFLTLVAFSIPWFLWGDGRLYLGVPVWIWWHAGWMVVTAGAFWIFVQRSWGLWITEAGS
ncbi:DUF3311 domain-containing protein [Natronorarus salvus]|uniref:DUF3311 domain-containing protein n=1 Tax=Natronorarus salvus TaxID=3117733 RepID=UPI002F26807B